MSKNKYQRMKEQYSVDGGITWQDVTPPNYRAGRLIEIDSADCGGEYYGEYLTTEMLENGTIGLANTSSDPTYWSLSNIQYSKNNEQWTSIQQNNLISVQQGDVIKWKANGKQIGNIYTTAQPNNNSWYNNPYITSFTGSATFDAYGNIKSLLYSDNFTTFDETGKTVRFYGLFRNSKIVDASNIVISSNIASRCYNWMFGNCTSLTTAPSILPATTLANHCYASMFYGCTSLTTAPVLPATTLAEDCYGSMFSRCSSLVNPPALPATSLAVNCYAYMFLDCTSLTTAPVLPATTLAEECYDNMFAGCTSITTAPVLSATTMKFACYNAMFYRCSSLVNPPVLPATTLAEHCYAFMFADCTSLTTAPALPATTMEDTCYEAMFENCTSLTTAPVLAATILANQCYWQLFRGCTSLNYIKAMFTTTPSTTYTEWWVKDVAATGTFVKNSAASWNVTGDNGVPSGWTVQTASS